MVAQAVEQRLSVLADWVQIPGQTLAVFGSDSRSIIAGHEAFSNNGVILLLSSFCFFLLFFLFLSSFLSSFNFGKLINCDQRMYNERILKNNKMRPGRPIIKKVILHRFGTNYATTSLCSCSAEVKYTLNDHEVMGSNPARRLVCFFFFSFSLSFIKIVVSLISSLL